MEFDKTLETRSDDGVLLSCMTIVGHLLFWNRKSESALAIFAENSIIKKIKHPIIDLSEVFDMSEEKKNGTVVDSDQVAEQMKDFGSVMLKKGDKHFFCLTVIGEIEGHMVLPEQTKTTKYEHVIPQLVAVQEDPNIDGLLVILNTVGGDVEAGLALAELISGIDKPTVSYVIGGGHSIGVPLAVSAQRSFIAPSATMTVHPVRMNGLVLGVPQMLHHFERMQDRITRFVVEHSHIQPERFQQLLMNTGEMVTDMGSVLDGQAAVKEGLIDGLGGLSDVLHCLYEFAEHKQ